MTSVTAFFGPAQHEAFCKHLLAVQLAQALDGDCERDIRNDFKNIVQPNIDSCRRGNVTGPSEMSKSPYFTLPLPYNYHRVVITSVDNYMNLLS